MTPRYPNFWVYLLLPLGLFGLAACGAGPGPASGQPPTPTPVAPLPSPVQTGVPAAVPSTGPSGLPTATPVPPPPTHDSARPISYAELRAAASYPTVPAFDWALGKAVQNWQGWVVDADRRAGKTVIPVVIVMDDPYAPLPPPAAAQRPYNENSALAYVLLENLAAMCKQAGCASQPSTKRRSAAWSRRLRRAITSPGTRSTRSRT